jgi:hypothetical protein
LTAGKSKKRNEKFETDGEEIDFFRNVKPAFTRFIEYYRILNEALLFMPPNEPLQWPYWNNELGRYSRFRNKHVIFTRQYEGNRREKDEMYFLTRNYVVSTAIPMNVYDTDSSFCTLGDPLVSSLLALSMYRNYVNARLKTMVYHNETGL